jgi:hypothetical protein
MEKQNKDLTVTELLMNCMEEIGNPGGGLGTVTKAYIILVHSEENGDSGLSAWSNLEHEHEKLGILRAGTLIVENRYRRGIE